MFKEWYYEASKEAGLNRAFEDRVKQRMGEIVQPDDSRMKEIVRRPEETVAPSTLGGCRRRVYFEFIKMERKKQPIQMKQWLRFQMGHNTHAMTQALIEVYAEKLGSEFSTEIHISRKGVFGYLDGILHSHCDGPFLLEIKSTRHDLFKDLKQPFPSAKLQVGGYAHALGYSSASILYINQDSGQAKEFESPVSMGYEGWLPAAKDKAASVLESIRVAAKMRQIPPASKKDYHCKICPFVWCCGAIET